MVKHEIAVLLRQAGEEAQRRGALPPVALTDTAVERTTNPAHGDYASSLPLRLARAARMSPLAIARTLVEHLPPAAFVGKVEVAAPGFINFTLDPSWLSRQVDAIVAAGPEFGQVDVGGGASVQVEFVSANPTGPLGVPNGRAAALGDALANVLAKANFRVEREYYVNNEGSRMESFYHSLSARYLQQFGRSAEVPPDGYHGEYLVDLAREIIADEGDRYLRMPPAEAANRLGEIGVERVVASARRDLDRMGVRYDVWFSEHDLYASSLVSKVLDLLRSSGYIAEREGAVWFASSALGEDKDNVLIRSNGAPTYFCSDIAYHYDKFVRRNFNRVIDIWGADHQGHVPRMRAAAAALIDDPGRLVIIIHQMVTLRRGQEIVRMSKRTGDIVTLRELLDEVAPDACRFFFLSRSADNHMDFDLELAKKQSTENPVYYVQYAHARIASILRYAAEAGHPFDADGDVELLTTEPEHALIRKMLALPELVELAATTYSPHHLPHYALELGTVFHQFYTQCRVVSEDVALTRARLKLVRAAKIVLANTLALMGMTAPEEMKRENGD